MDTSILIRLLPYVHNVLLTRYHSHSALSHKIKHKLQELDLEDLLNTTAAYVQECNQTQNGNSILVALESVEKQLTLVRNHLEHLQTELESQTRWSAWLWTFIFTPRDIDPLLTTLKLNTTILRHRLDLLFGVVRSAPQRLHKSPSTTPDDNVTTSSCVVRYETQPRHASRGTAL